MMPTSVQSFSTISSTCEVRKTVAPRPTHCLSVSRNTRDATASTPSNGSSRNSRSGFGISAAARESFFFMPCENSSVSFFSSCARSIMASNSSQRARTVSRGRRYIRPDEREVFARRQVVEQRQVFRHHADAAFHRERAFRVADVFAEDAHRAAAGRQQAGEHLDGGGFARAVRAEKTVETARPRRAGSVD